MNKPTPSPGSEQSFPRPTAVSFCSPQLAGLRDPSVIALRSGTSSQASSQLRAQPCAAIPELSAGAEVRGAGGGPGAPHHPKMICRRRPGTQCLHLNLKRWKKILELMQPCTGAAFLGWRLLSSSQLSPVEPRGFLDPDGIWTEGVWGAEGSLCIQCGVLWAPRWPLSAGWGWPLPEICRGPRSPCRGNITQVPLLSLWGPGPLLGCSSLPAVEAIVAAAPGVSATHRSCFPLWAAALCPLLLPPASPCLPLPAFLL